MNRDMKLAVRFARYYCAKCSHALPHSPEQVYEEWIDQRKDIDEAELI